MSRRSRDYHKELIKDLKDHEEAAAYLNAALEESMKGDIESQELFLKALRNVAEAHGGLGALARRAHLNRENLYRILSEKGNPEFKTFVMLISALGFNLKLI